MTRTRLIWLLAGVCGTVLVKAVIGHAAPQMKMVTIGGDDADGTAMIAELGALIFEKDSTLTVEHVMEAGQRPKTYQKVDLKQGDVILMVNGKRARTAVDFSGILDSLTAGDEVKLGIRRDKNMQIVSFKKAAPEDLPQIKMVTQTLAGDEKPAGEGGPRMKMVTRTEGGAGSDGQLAVLLGSGLIFKQDGEAVVVLATMPESKDALGSVEVREGDRILKLQDKDITGPVMLQELYDAIAVGDSVRVVMTRDRKEFSVSFEKRETPDNIIIEKH